LPSMDGKNCNALKVATLLGWTQKRTNGAGVQMNRTADACSSASELLRLGHNTCADFADMPVRDAREILTRAIASIKRINTAAKRTGASAAHVTQATRAVAKAVTTTAEQSRAGTVRKVDLRQQVDVNAYKHAKAFKAKNNPLFAQFGSVLANSVAKMLTQDTSAKKLSEVIAALGNVHSMEDKQTVARLAFELDALKHRADKLATAMVLPEVKVVPLKALEKDTDNG